MKVFRVKTLIAEEIVLFVLIFVGFALLVFSVNPVQAEEVSKKAWKPLEECYIELEINEKKVGEKIQFSLGSQENLYGLYDGLVDFYDEEVPGDYILNVYNTEGKLLNQYSLYSGRYILWDNFSGEGPPGGTVELGEGIISPVIHYEDNIGSIKIENEGKETDLNVDVSAIKCERTCKIEGEIGNYKTDRCCIGFIPVTIDNKGNFICVNCGDGICSEYEDRWNCPEDCDPEYQKRHSSSKEQKERKEQPE